MSTIKSSAENLTLNADGANNDVIIQSNGSTKVTVDGQNSRVGIGTTTPLAKVDIVGNTDTWGGMARVFLTDTATNSGSRNWAIGNGGTDYGHLSVIVSNAKGGAPESSTGTTAVVINSAGVVSIPSGIELGSGVDATAANTLDDYEEGTFIPKMGDNSTTMHTVVRASYVKVGKLVTLDIDVQTPTYSGANPHYIMNLPFTTSVASNGGGAVGYVDESDVVPAFHITGASTTLYFLNLRTGGTYNLSNKRVIFSVTYHIP